MIHGLRARPSTSPSTAASVQLVLIDEIHRLNPRTTTGAQLAGRATLVDPRSAPGVGLHQ
ncbi:hypothetical protein [Streptomyces sp. NPDC046197]|uniref:hypothetical protein n=1 Tax=Streptomyces sp. NPDC046197 TaxID=3154337 RepID=UPI0033D88108